MDFKLIREYTQDMVVLYVEDEALVREETKSVLERFFKRVDTAEDGIQGLASYKSALVKDSPYDIVVTDLRMPNMDGVLMSQHIIDLHDEQSIIVISAHDEAEYLRPLLNLGVEQFILKPIDVTSIARAFLKTCRAHYDHMMLHEHIEQIEALNLELEEKNIALEKSLRLVQSKEVKEKIVYAQTHTQERTKEEEVDPSLQAMIREDLPELVEIFEELDARVVSNSHPGATKDLTGCSELIRKYGAILSAYNVFKELSNAFLHLATIMVTLPLPNDAEKEEHIFLMLESFVYTLKQWQEEWSHIQSVDTNFFDASMISDIAMIINLWSNKEDEAEEIEFF